MSQIVILHPDLVRARTPCPAPSNLSSVSAGYKVPSYYVDRLWQAGVVPMHPYALIEHPVLQKCFTKAEYERQKGQPVWKDRMGVPVATIALENLSQFRIAKSYAEQSLHGELEVILRVSIELVGESRIRC
jgi:hypothetical protein